MEEYYSRGSEKARKKERQKLVKSESRINCEPCPSCLLNPVPCRLAFRLFVTSHASCR